MSHLHLSSLQILPKSVRERKEATWGKLILLGTEYLGEILRQTEFPERKIISIYMSYYKTMLYVYESLWPVPWTCGLCIHRFS